MKRHCPRTSLAVVACAACLPFAALAQVGTAPATSAGVPNAPSAVPLPRGIVPNRAELPMSAFNKLDADGKGYVTAEDVRQLEGFASAFQQADQNRDGRLNASEFNSAWSIYTGNNP